MISNHKIQTALDEIKDISRIDLALYTEKGKPVAATFEPEGDLEGAITSFADSMAESQMLSGYHFFKVIADGEIEYILLTKSQAEDAYMVGRLAVCQIRNLAAAYMEQFDRNNFMQNILLGNMLVVDMYNKAQKLHIEQAERVVYVIDLEDKKDSTAVELVKNLFATKMRDYVTEVDEQSIVLIKDVRDVKNEDELEFPEADYQKEEIYRQLYLAIDRLPKKCREIFLMYMDGKKNEEIAQILSISIETVKTQKKRAMRFLKDDTGIKMTYSEMLALLLLLFK